MSEDIARQFVEAYYTTLQNNKEEMIQFYTEDSIMSSEGNHQKGTKEIQDRLDGLSFKKINHEVVSMDAHPSPIENGLLIMITGKMKMDDDPPFKFAQTFHLVPNNNGGYFCANDIFRLVMSDKTAPGQENE
mmetsp:Transcript_31858/g.28895  ORF Transcript_31858/g.28895 Transcript_31858/m.28895 type:complete len:132 (+) Transcript_31858:33-428(+)